MICAVERNAAKEPVCKPLRDSGVELHNALIDESIHGRINLMRKTTGMSSQQLEAFCGKWAGVTRDIKWENNLVFSVAGKMFAMMPADGSDGGRLSCKVDDARFLELTDQPGIIPAPYLARARWISIIESQRFTTADLQDFIRDAYLLVRARLTKKLQAELAPLPTAKANEK